jgi:N-acetylgalactosamine kinase
MAAVLRLQLKYSTVQLRGVDVMVSGNIPIAAGLSSSSALVVAAAESMIAVNQLDTFPSQFVDLCGEGEWFVGTRGGSADHAAIKLGPQKTTNAKDQFNHRVACYRIGLKLLRKRFPQYAHLLHHLRDFNTRTLGTPLSWIYKSLLRLPEQATQQELREMLVDERPLVTERHGDPYPLESLFATHRAPLDGLYPIRGVVLYGLAECERSRLFADALKSQRIDQIGRLMTVSHDGDRVARTTDEGTQVPHCSPTSNSYLLDLIEDLESGEPERVERAQLQWQPGGYGCSVPEIDYMVDLALNVEGVVGAQLAGAGLGGCMMVLAHSNAVSGLRAELMTHYYGPYEQPPAILLCEPIAGSSVLLMNED